MKLGFIHRPSQQTVDYNLLLIYYMCMTNKRKKSHLIQVPLNEALFNKVHQYMIENDHDSMADAARALFREGTDTPAYIAIQKERLASMKTPEEKIKDQVSKENLRIKAREQAKVDKQIYFCHALGGKETPDGYCEYNQFVESQGETIDVLPQREPLESMHERSGDYQFLSVWADEKTPKAQYERIMDIGKKQKNLHVDLPTKNN